MSVREAVIGIDTSNYTTSVAIMGIDGAPMANIKRLLPVDAGQCGLRQSDALFAHVKALPVLMREAEPLLADLEIRAVGVSTRPRNVEGSYMPVFLAGCAVAESLSATMGVPLYSFSHQCGHIMAALCSAGRLDLLDSEFTALHASGGTTELLRVKGTGHGFSAELIGGTLDLNAGQVIDRVGVMLGMPFPCGRHLEAEALRFEGVPHRPAISRKGMHINLSGVENMAERLRRDGKDAPEIAAFVLDYVGRAVEKIIAESVAVYGKGPIVCAGGVMCNSIIRRMLQSKHDVYFAEPDMSSDNAVGIAALALHSYKAAGR